MAGPGGTYVNGATKVEKAQEQTPRTPHHERVAPGKVCLIAVDGSRYTLAFDVDAARTFAAKLRQLGYQPGFARPLAALTAPQVDDTALVVAIREFCGDAPDDVRPFMQANRHRLKAWWRGLTWMIKSWYGVEGAYDEKATGRIIMGGESEARLKREDGGATSFVYDFEVGQHVQMTLRQLGYDNHSSVPLIAIEGVPDESVLGALLVHGTKFAKLNLDAKSVDAFMTKNRERLFGWWFIIQRCMRGFYDEEVEEASGEDAGAG